MNNSILRKPAPTDKMGIAPGQVSGLPGRWGWSGEPHSPGFKELLLPIAAGCLFLLLAWLPGLLFAANSPAPGGAGKGGTGDSAVYYRLESVVVDGEPVEVLLPALVTAPQGALPPQLQEFVFTVLREKNPRLYGTTSIYVNPDRSVTVHPDARLVQNPHHLVRVLAELVYSLTEQGASRVYVPDFQPDPLDRAHVDQFSVFLSVAPLWRVLPPQPMLPGLIRFPDGQILDSETVRSLITNKDQLVVDSALGALRSSSVPQVLAGLASLRAVGVEDATAQFMGLLDHGAPQVRAAAASELVGQGLEQEERVLEAVAARMAREDDREILEQLATFLRKSPDPRYGQHAWLYDLKYGGERAGVQAARALGAAKMVDGVAGLAAAAAGGQWKELRLEAVHAIAAIGDQRQLVTLIAHPQVPGEVKTGAAHHLTRSENPEDAMNGWVYLLQSGADVPLAVEAAGALAKGADRRVVAWLVQAVEEHSARQVREAASRALGELGDVRAVEVLVKKAGEGVCGGDGTGVGAGGPHRVAGGPEDGALEECVVHREQAVKVMAGQRVDVIVRTAREGGSVGVRQLAVGALGQKFKELSSDKRGSDQVLALLQELVESGAAQGNAGVGVSAGGSGPTVPKSGDGDQSLVVAAILALGETGHSQGLDLIVGQAGHSDRSVRGAVAASLGKFPPPQGSETLYGLIDDLDDQVRLQAVAAARERQDEGAVEYLIKYRSHGNPLLREEVLWALAEINPVPWQSTLRDVFSESVFAPEATIRLAAVEGLSRIKNPRVLDIMAVLLQDRDQQVQLATIKAYGESGFPQALQPLETLLLGGEDEAVRLAAARALGELGRRGVEGVDGVLERALTSEKSHSVREALLQLAGEGAN